MPKIENRWTVGNIAAVLAALATMITIGVTIYSWGKEWGDLLSRVSGLEQKAEQSVSDSRTLIELRTDVAYIKAAIQDIRSIAVSGQVTCGDDKPILVVRPSAANSDRFCR